MIFCTARLAPEKTVTPPVLPLHLTAEALEKAMAGLTYAQQLKHPKWQKRRLEILSRSDFTCRMCGDSDTTLHVHHKHYIKGRMAWEYSDREFVVLCEPCHDQQHIELEADKMLLAQFDVDGPGGRPAAMALVAGYGEFFIDGEFIKPYEGDLTPFILGQIARRLDQQSANLFPLIDLYEALEAPGFYEQLSSIAKTEAERIRAARSSGKDAAPNA